MIYLSQSTSSFQNNYNYITIASVISAISVVILHANQRYWHYSEESWWSIANVIESLFYFAVPVFFMITGATLIDYNKRYSTKEYFKKRFRRTVIPFLAWSCIGVVWYYRAELFALVKQKESNGIDLSVGKFLNGIINTSFMDVYWFFIPLFCVYLVIPFFSCIPEYKRKRMFSYIVLLTFIMNITIPFFLTLINRVSMIKYSWPISISVGANYFFYVLVGYLIHNYDIGRKMKAVIYMLAFLGLFLHIIGTWYLSRKYGTILMDFKNYINFPCALYSIGVFVLIKDLGLRAKSNSRMMCLMNYMKQYTFELYLIHQYILRYFYHVAPLIGISTNSELYVISSTMITIILCIIIAAIMKRVPVIKYIVP